jgi:hypothetical protein
LKGKNKTAGGFKWMYKKDYVVNGNTPILFKVKYKGKSVVKLDLNGNFIKEYSSIQEAMGDMEVKTSKISECCIGRRKTAGGFKWMYKEEYEALLE